LREQADKTEDFGDVANIVLTGFIGSVWMILSVRRHLPSKFHLIWFVPLTLLLFVALLSLDFMVRIDPMYGGASMTRQLLADFQRNSRIC
jgi:hypothetical protein